MAAVTRQQPRRIVYHFQDVALWDTTRAASALGAINCDRDRGTTVLLGQTPGDQSDYAMSPRSAADHDDAGRRTFPPFEYLPFRQLDAGGGLLSSLDVETVYRLREGLRAAAVRGREQFQAYARVGEASGGV